MILLIYFHFQKAISENHSRKRRKMAPAEALLKKQGQQEVLKDIAAQAAELVALKKDHAVISTERAATDASEKRKAAEKMMREARADVSEEPAVCRNCIAGVKRRKGERRRWL